MECITSSIRTFTLLVSAAAVLACSGTESSEPAISLQANAADTVDLVAAQNGSSVGLDVLLTPTSGVLPSALTASPSFALGATGGWLSGLVIVADSASALLRVTAAPGTLLPGVYMGQLDVSSPAGGVNTLGVPVRLSIGLVPTAFAGLYVGSYTRVTTGGCTTQTLTRPVTFSVLQAGAALTIRLALQDPDFIALSGLQTTATAAGSSFSGDINFVGTIPGTFSAFGSISGRRNGVTLSGTVQLTAPDIGCSGRPKFHAITYTAQRPNAASLVLGH